MKERFDVFDKYGWQVLFIEAPPNLTNNFIVETLKKGGE